MKKFITAMCFILVAPSALAWGDREQGALIGFTAGAILSNINQHPTQQSQPVYVQRIEPIYVERHYVPPPRQRPVYGTRIVYDEVCRCYREMFYQIGWE